MSDEFRVVFKTAGASSVGGTSGAEFCLALGFFKEKVEDAERAEPDLVAVLFRLKHKLSSAKLMEFKDKYKEKLQKTFQDKPTVVLPAKVLVAVAQPEETDTKKIYKDVKVKKDEDTVRDIAGKEIDAAWEMLNFPKRGKTSQAAPSEVCLLPRVIK